MWSVDAIRHTLGNLAGCRSCPCKRPHLDSNRHPSKRPCTEWPAVSPVAETDRAQEREGPFCLCGTTPTASPV
eukprot:6583533-Prorocentrum_lima.AAC.1